MRQFTAKSLVFFNLLLVGGLSGCGSLAQATNGINFGLGNNIANISDAKSSQQQGIVNLQGQVTDIVPLMEPWQAYQLQDASGTVWVITSQPGLSKADRVLIKGNLRYQSIPLDRQELGDFYIEEQERTKQTPAS